ncbi:Predicted hydrolases or acyltransferases (alpha/beta hydrolase superfamily) [Enterobacter cancerogenus]|uniref:Predicted hydrolases or acyltransferases (Alpha/beta hydrolase superfamily) n=1 Tax=Enterobacter cancerogenus TaxID=69218 RepID=A0A484Z3L3_9ENTR|nr:Predicted hydrolases or acyltransferases (alpha/beta hydrolase superfamily) [Enterobacter cancerogenus]
MKALSVLTAGLLALSASALAENHSSVVLVHGAFADGSSWNKVISRLQEQHREVIAVQLPLTSLHDDVAATRRAIARAHGKVTLVGHSWAGTVISEAGNDARVTSLVYVAAFAPDSGQSTADLVGSYPAPPGSADIAKTTDGYLYLPSKRSKKTSRLMSKRLSRNALLQRRVRSGPMRLAKKSRMPPGMINRAGLW